MDLVAVEGDEDVGIWCWGRESLPCRAHDLMQTIPWVRGQPLPPERINCLLAMQSVIWSKRQQLDEGTRALKPPGIFPDRCVINRDGETAQQANLHRLSSSLLGT